MVAEKGFEIKVSRVIAGVRYKKGIRGVQLAKLNSDGTDIVGKLEEFPADLVAVSGGWSPTLNLYSQAGGV